MPARWVRLSMRYPCAAPMNTEHFMPLSIMIPKMILLREMSLLQLRSARPMPRIGMSTIGLGRKAKAGNSIPAARLCAAT